MNEKPLHPNPEASEEMAANAVVRYLRESEVRGEANKKKWIKRVFDRVISKELAH